MYPVGCQNNGTEMIFRKKKAQKKKEGQWNLGRQKNHWRVFKKTGVWSVQKQLVFKLSTKITLI